METDFLASGNHFVPISEMLFLMEAVFPSRGNMFLTNPSLRISYFIILLNGNDILSFHIFFETIIK